MPDIKIREAEHSRRLRERVVLRLAREGIAAQAAPSARPRLDPGRFAANLVFQVSHAAFVLRDRLLSIRDRIPSFPNLAPSTWLAYGAVILMVAVLIRDLIGPTPANSSITPTPDKRPDWIELTRAHPSFALESSVLDGLETAYVVRRHRAGGGRKDELTFGGPDIAGTHIRVSLYRPGREGMAEPDPLDAVAAVAATAGINAEIVETDGKLRTKFGLLPVVQMDMDTRLGTRNCIAIASAWSDPRLGLVAWWCNPGPEIVAQGQFACLLDRIALLSAGHDDQLAEFFARAELQRNFCNAHGSFVSPTPRLVNDWVHAKRGPQLRGKLSAR